jgi:hypothetical protein
MIRVVHPVSVSRILIFYPSRIQGPKRHRIPDPDPQHCEKLGGKNPSVVRFCWICTERRQKGLDFWIFSVSLHVAVKISRKFALRCVNSCKNYVFILKYLIRRFQSLHA